MQINQQEATRVGQASDAMQALRKDPKVTFVERQQSSSLSLSLEGSEEYERPIRSEQDPNHPMEVWRKADKHVVSYMKNLHDKFQANTKLKRIVTNLVARQWPHGRHQIRIAPSGTTTATANIARTKPTRQNIAVKTKASNRPTWVGPSVPERGYIREAEDSRLEYSNTEV